MARYLVKVRMRGYKKASMDYARIPKGAKIMRAKGGYRVIHKGRRGVILKGVYPVRAKNLSTLNKRIIKRIDRNY